MPWRRMPPQIARPSAQPIAISTRDKRDQRQAHVEDRIMIERDRQQHRRQDADRDPDHAHRQQRQHPFIGPQRRHEQLAEIARPHLFEKRDRQAELAAEQQIPQHHGGEQYAEGLRDIAGVLGQELAHEPPDQHLQGRPVQQLQRARPRTAQDVQIAQQHRPDAGRRKACLAEPVHRAMFASSIHRGVRFKLRGRRLPAGRRGPLCDAADRACCGSRCPGE